MFNSLYSMVPLVLPKPVMNQVLYTSLHELSNRSELILRFYWKKFQQYEENSFNKSNPTLIHTHVSTRGDSITLLITVYIWINEIALNQVNSIFTGDSLHSRTACTQPCNVNTHSRAHCSPGARLCAQWGHGCVHNGARLCASARLCRGSPVILIMNKNRYYYDFQTYHTLLNKISWVTFQNANN